MFYINVSNIFHPSINLSNKVPRSTAGVRRVQDVNTLIDMCMRYLLCGTGEGLGEGRISW